MTDRHDKALEAAARAVARVDDDPSLGEACWDYYVYHARAAILAFLEAVEPATLVPAMQEARIDGGRMRFSDAYGEVMARAALAQLRRELADA